MELQGLQGIEEKRLRIETPAQVEPVLHKEELSPTHRKHAYFPKFAKGFFLAAVTALGAFAVKDAAGFDQNTKSSPVAMTESVQQPQRFLRQDLLDDDTYLYAGSKLTYSDILRRVKQLRLRFFRADVPKEVQQRVQNSISMLLSSKELWPQAVRYAIVQEGEYFTLVPEVPQNVPEMSRTAHADIVILGGELESITTAIHAADAGKSVILLWSGALGGVSSDTGANMRYFDYADVAVTPGQQKLMQVALSMTPENKWAIPADTSARLLTYLKNSYPDIELIQTKTYDTLLVKKSVNLASMLTEEGVQVSAESFIDSTPEAVLAEKSSLPVSMETPHLGYGMVFTVKGLDQATLIAMNKSPLLNPDTMLKSLGVSLEAVKTAGQLMQSYSALKALSGTTDTWSPNQHASFGFHRLGKSYDFFMRLLELRSPDTELALLNKDRVPDAFNVSFSGGDATLNSLSYRTFKGSPKAVRQNAHDIHVDPEFSLIRDIEIPSLQKFLQRLAGKDLQIITPKELYVRKSHFSVQTPFEPADAVITEPSADLTMRYPIDVRAATAIDSYDKTREKIAALQEQYPKVIEWTIQADQARTDIPNLYVISKNATDPHFSGCLRIMQNLMGVGYKVIEEEQVHKSAYGGAHRREISSDVIVPGSPELREKSMHS